MDTKKLLAEQLTAIANRAGTKTRPVKPSEMIQHRYNAELQRIVRGVREDINSVLIPAIRALQRQYMGDAWSDDVKSIFNRIREKWSSPAFKALADRIASQFVRNAGTINAERFKKSVGIDVYGDSPELQDYLSASIFDNTRLIESIPSQYLDQVESIVYTNMRAGLRSSAIVDEIQSRFGVTRNRAVMIARDQTAKVNGDIAEKRMRNVGFEYFQWLTSSDERVRDRHREIADKVTEYGPGVYRWDNLPLSDDGEPIKPGSDYQCFPYESKLNVFSGVRKVFRHWYTGELTELVTASGETIRATRNHPILTDRGFVAIKDIDVGENVIKVFNQTFGVSDTNTQCSDLMIGECFDAFNLVFFSNESTGIRGSEFHGDLTHEKINIITLDRILPNIVNIHQLKEFFKLFFTASDVMISGRCITSISNLQQLISGSTGAPDSIVSVCCKLLSLVSTGLTHSDEHSLTSIGLLYARLIENSSDDISRNVEFFGDCFDAHIPIDTRLNLFKRYIYDVCRFCFGFGDNETPGAESFTKVVGVASEDVASGFKSVTLSYEVDRVVAKLVVEFTGHVYNLEMGRGLYVTQNIAVSNCRCVARPVNNEEVEKNKREGRTVPDVKR